MADKNLLSNVKAALQKQLETINRLVTEDIHAHQMQLATNHSESQVSEELKLLVGPSASLRLTLEASPGQDDEVITWTALMQLTAGAHDGQGYGALAQLLARYLLLCLKRQGQLDKVPSSCSSPELLAEPYTVSLFDKAEESDSEDDEQPATVAVNMNTLSRFGPKYLMLEKEIFLSPSSLRAVRKLTNVHCSEDPTWTLQLLEETAPRLQELQLMTASEAHLRVVETMRQLSRLELQYYAGDWERPLEFSLTGGGGRGLEWLKVVHLPEDTTMSLVRAHRRTLRELWLGVGTWASSTAMTPSDRRRVEVPEDEKWPVSCKALQVLLDRCQLQALWRLVLFRWLFVHDRESCSKQIDAVRDVLPGVTVLCYDCHGVQNVSL